MNNSIHQIIVRILSSEASPEDIRQLLKWVDESQENKKEFAQYEMLWNALEIIGNKKDFDIQKAYAKFNSQIQIPDSRLKSFHTVSSFWKIAAIIVVVSGMSYLAGYLKQTSCKVSVEPCQIVTPKGSQTFIELPDGSKVWLNAESKLKYSDNFSGKERNVYLEGEAYFEIAKDRQHPFIVHTSKINVRAIGTAFNVKSYPAEEIIQTTLIRGSVAIEKQDTLTHKEKGKNVIVYLQPNQQATFYKSTAKMEIISKNSVAKSTAEKTVFKSSNIIIKKDSLLVDTVVNTEIFTAWKENKLIFDNESFASLSVKLERRFNMKFHFMDNQLRSFRFTGHFDEISVEQFMEALNYASPFYYTINKKDIYLSMKPIIFK